MSVLPIHILMVVVPAFDKADRKPTRRILIALTDGISYLLDSQS